MPLELILGFALIAQPAPEPELPSAAERVGSDYFAGLQAQVGASGTARERALFLRSTDGNTAAIREAARQAPGDPLVQMAASTFGVDILAWSRVEPGNGLAWVPALTDEEGTVDAGIARIANAREFDDHFVDAWLAYRDLYRKRPMPQPMIASSGNGDRALAIDVMAMGHAAALPVPIAKLFHACDRTRHPRAPESRFENCARIGRSIQSSNASGFSKGWGGSLVRVSGLQTSSDLEARRVLDWKRQTATELLGDTPGRELAEYFADLASTGSEVRAQELLLARHGIPMEPPEGFKGRK